MTDWQQEQNYYDRDLTQKRNWYSTVAEAYQETRPRYPQKLIKRVIELAQLAKGASILEIGCGPGTATVDLAERGFNLISLEPSQEAYQLARRNCARYPQVRIENTTFEEWELEVKTFDAVLAATSFHWIAPEIRYLKTASALKKDGFVILLWNTEVQPQTEIYQIFKQVYLDRVPSLVQFHEKERTEQSQQLDRFGQTLIDSGYFKNLITEQCIREVSYSIDDYLKLLTTYSPYLNLEAKQRDSLLTSLRQTSIDNCIDRISGSYISAFQIGQKV